MMKTNKEKYLFCRGILNLLRESTPHIELDFPDKLDYGRTGQHEATTYSNKHEIKMTTEAFCCPKEAVSTLVHEAYHASLHDVNSMLLAGGRITKEELELIMERSAWFCGYAASQVLENSDKIKKQFSLIGRTK